MDSSSACRSKFGTYFFTHLANANNDANPKLTRLALELASGAGKTTVMTMLIAWQTVNAVRRAQQAVRSWGSSDLMSDAGKELERNCEAAWLRLRRGHGCSRGR